MLTVPAGGGAGVILGDARLKKIKELTTRASADTKQCTYSANLGPRGALIGRTMGDLLPPFPSPEFPGDLRIAETILVEVKQVQAQPVLHLALAQIVQVRLPVPILAPNLPPHAPTKECVRHHRNPALAARH